MIRLVSAAVVVVLMPDLSACQQTAVAPVPVPVPGEHRKTPQDEGLSSPGVEKRRLLELREQVNRLRNETNQSEAHR